MGLTLTDLRLQCAPPVCICTVPRFDGPCHCERDHLPGECRNCHRPYKPQLPGFDDCRRAWMEAVA